MGKPFTLKYRHGDKYYIYDVNSNCVLDVDKALYTVINHVEITGDSPVPVAEKNCEGCRVSLTQRREREPGAGDDQGRLRQQGSVLRSTPHRDAISVQQRRDAHHPLVDPLPPDSRRHRELQPALHLLQVFRHLSIRTPTFEHANDRGDSAQGASFSNGPYQLHHQRDRRADQRHFLWWRTVSQLSPYPELCLLHRGALSRAPRARDFRPDQQLYVAD